MKVAIIVNDACKSEVSMRYKKPKFLLEWHKRLGITIFVSALIHAILVLIAHYFLGS